ncbi:MAG: hypothetical protein KDA05_10440, partial [Phycisphaerales bacterium]|nr:hypothetical protein [Phycisphaerales bacterium]
TYGEVTMRAEADGPRLRTGMQFLGAIVGDHVKTAIGTRIMTGAVLHTGCMFAQTAAVAGTVGPFTWATDRGMQPFRFDKFMEIARTVMARRHIEPTDAYASLLAELHTEAVGA